MTYATALVEMIDEARRLDAEREKLSPAGVGPERKSGVDDKAIIDHLHVVLRAARTRVAKVRAERDDARRALRDLRVEYARSEKHRQAYQGALVTLLRDLQRGSEVLDRLSQHDGVCECPCDGCRKAVARDVLRRMNADPPVTPKRTSTPEEKGDVE